MTKLCICGQVMTEQPPDPKRPQWTTWICPSGHEMGYRDESDIHAAAAKLTERIMQDDDPTELLDRLLKSDGPLPDPEDMDAWIADHKA